MALFFVDEEIQENEISIIVGEDARHISRSLRMAVGDSIRVSTPTGNIFDCTIVRFEDDRRVFFKTIKQCPSTESSCRITLFQCMPKTSDKMEYIIQKCVECGVFEIVPVKSSNSLYKFNIENKEKKIERWNKISKEAAQQSGRGIIPHILNDISFNQMGTELQKFDLTLFCFEGRETVPIGIVLNNYIKENYLPHTVALVIGPEGGFTENEVNIVKNAGGALVGLGPRILRTETAGIFSLSCISCFYELS